MNKGDIHKTFLKLGKPDKLTGLNLAQLIWNCQHNKQIKLQLKVFT